MTPSFTSLQEGIVKQISLKLTVSAVGHVGDHADDALAGGALASVARDQQLHNRIVYVPEREWQMGSERNCYVLYVQI